jgi:hypothetical protein
MMSRNGVSRRGGKDGRRLEDSRRLEKTPKRFHVFLQQFFDEKIRFT